MYSLFLLTFPVALHAHDLLIHELLLMIKLQIDGLHFGEFSLKFTNLVHQEFYKIIIRHKVVKNLILTSISANFLEILLKILHLRCDFILKLFRYFTFTFLNCFLYMVQNGLLGLHLWHVNADIIFDEVKVLVNGAIIEL